MVVTDAVVHTTLFIVNKSLIITEKVNACWFWLADDFYFQLKQIVFFIWNQEAWPITVFLWASLALLYISRDQEIQEDIFYPNLFLHFCVLKMMDEIT